MKNITDNVKRDKEYINHLNRYLNEPILQKALADERSLKKQVEDFYDVKDTQTHMARGVPPFETFNFKKPFKENYDKSPSKLIEIVAPFHKEDLDESLLKYNLVIEDNIRFDKSWSGRLVGTLTHIGAFAGTVGAAVCSSQNPIYIPVALTSFLLVLYTGIEKPFFPEMKNFSEFGKLREAGRKADRFISDSYKSNFIKQNLEQNKK